MTLIPVAGAKVILNRSLIAVFIFAGAPAAQLPDHPLTSPAKGGSAFSIGEKLVFLVEWKPPWFLFFIPPIEAGEAELRVSEEVEYQGKTALKLEFNARSSGALLKMAGISVDDHFEFITDPETLCTHRFTKIEREGKRKRNIEVTYLPESRKLHIQETDAALDPPVVKKDLYRDDIPECVKDPFSALYFTRRREFQAGSSFKSVVGDNDRIKEVEARVEKTETVRTPAGVFEVWRVNTVSLVGGLFKEGGHFRMWLTNDEKKVPVQFEAKVNLGTVLGRLKSGKY